MLKSRRPQSGIARYVAAVRPWSLSVSLMPVLLGTTLSYRATGTISATLVFLTAIAIAAIHGAGNLVNTYYDFMNRVDRAENTETEDRTLVDGRLSPDQVSTLGAALYCFGMVVFALACALSPARIEQMALLFFGGLTGSFLYTGGIGFKYYALGDIVVILTFGPLAVLFTYLAQTGSLSLAPILLDIPLALHTEAVLLAKCAKEAEYSNVRTLPFLLGKSGSYFMYTAVLFIPYITFIFIAFNVSLWFILPAATVVPAFDLEKLFRAGRLKNLHRETLRVTSVMGCLYIASCCLAKNIPFM